jgi:16S rRNA processing protein RimM
MIDVAEILKPQGIKGEVKAKPLTNVLAVFENLKKINVEGKDFKIEKISLRQGFLYIKFSEVNDRNSAENLRNKKLYLEKEMLEENLQDDEILVDDLIGMLLFDTDGEKVGQIVDVENYGATFNLIIEKNGRTVQTPFVDGLLIKDGDTFKVNRKIFEEVSV